MTSTLLTFLQTIWPFMKESLLQGGTFKDWLKRHVTTCFWLVLLTIMLTIVFYLSDAIVQLRVETDKKLEEQKSKLADSRAAQAELKALQAQLKEEQGSNGRMRMFLVERCKLHREPCDFLIEETVRRPVIQREASEQAGNQQWCSLVRKGDLHDAGVRVRYLRECGMVTPTDSPLDVP